VSFASAFDIPISDEKIAETPFFRPTSSSREIRYLLDRRAQLGGFLPRRVVEADPLEIPGADFFAELLKGSGKFEVSTTMGFVRLLSLLIRDKKIGRQVVPIIPDEARTFGLDALFREIGIYSPKGPALRTCR
jgi:pyruvate dehydrogenase E1 component